jgi:hypothetical protein
MAEVQQRAAEGEEAMVSSMVGIFTTRVVGLGGIGWQRRQVVRRAVKAWCGGAQR